MENVYCFQVSICNSNTSNASPAAFGFTLIGSLLSNCAFVIFTNFYTGLLVVQQIQIFTAFFLYHYFHHSVFHMLYR